MKTTNITSSWPGVFQGRAGQLRCTGAMKEEVSS